MDVLGRGVPPGGLAGLTATVLAPVRAPFPVRVPHRVVPGPRPLGAEPHLAMDAAYPAVLRCKLQRLVTEPDHCRVRDPREPDDHGVALALWAALDRYALDLPCAVVVQDASVRLLALGVRLDGRGTPVPRLVVESAGWDLPGVAQARAHLAGLDGLALLADTLALAASDDLVVLRRRGTGALTAELLLVAVPTSWPPSQRAGADLSALHAPVGDNARLLSAGPALAEALLTKGPFQQFTWGVTTTDRLDLDPASVLRPPPASVPVGAAEVGERCWLRVERQTSLALPALGRALFLIRLFLTPLGELDGGQRAELAAALASMTPASRAYKGVEELLDPLLGWLTAAAPPPRSTPAA